MSPPKLKQAGPALDLLGDRDAARRAEMTSHPESVVGAALEGPAFALDADLIRVKGGVEAKGASGPPRLRKRWPAAASRATIPPSSLVMTMVAERRRTAADLSDWLACPSLLPSSPGRRRLANRARPSGGVWVQGLAPDREDV